MISKIGDIVAKIKTAKIDKCRHFLKLLNSLNKNFIMALASRLCSSFFEFLTCLDLFISKTQLPNELIWKRLIYIFFIFRFFSAFKRVVGGLVAIAVFSVYDPQYPASALYGEEFLVSVIPLFCFGIYSTRGL